MGKKSYILALLILVIIIIGGLVVLISQRKETTPLIIPATIETELPQNQNGNFVLYVNNASFAIDPVDIKILIDGKVAVSQDFYVGVESQHNWQKFQFSLSQGNHKIYVVSAKGEANLEKQFEIKDRHWAAVPYSYYPKSHYNPTPKQFNFIIQDEPIYFE